MTLEEHSDPRRPGQRGGRGAGRVRRGARLRRVGLPDAFAHAVGSREHLLAQFGMDAPGVVRAVLELLELSSPTLVAA